MSSNSQLNYWDSQSTVSRYKARSEHLYTAERRLLGLLRNRWPQVEMLDLGVGGGRTTSYFAELAGRYVGADFSPNMIEACKRRHAGRFPNAIFTVADATNLSDFQDGEFDLVMFTFNSIDCLTKEARFQALREMQRVCRPGGFVFFSSHNLYNIPVINQFQFQAHPMRLRDELNRWLAVKRKNMPLAEAMRHESYVRYYDDTIGENFLIFSRPEKQHADLISMGFKAVRLFSVLNGEELTLDQATDPHQSWVYYLCAR